VLDGDAFGQALGARALVLLRLVGDDGDLLRPSARMFCAICSTDRPSGRSPTGWPPVIATASL
jgi:hypothetical protein